MIYQGHSNKDPLPHATRELMGVQPKFCVDIWHGNGLQYVLNLLTLYSPGKAPMCTNSVTQLCTHCQDRVEPGQGICGTRPITLPLKRRRAPAVKVL